MRFIFHKITNLLKKGEEIFVKTKTADGNSEILMASPRGLYSNPQNEVALVLEQEKRVLAIPLQKHIDLSKGDVILTDDKNEIHLKKEDGKIEILGDSIFKDGVTIKGDLEVEGNVKVKGDISGDKKITAIEDIEGKNVKADMKVSAMDVEATTDVKGGGISLIKHIHSGETLTGNQGAPIIGMTGRALTTEALSRAKRRASKARRKNRKKNKKKNKNKKSRNKRNKK